MSLGTRVLAGAYSQWEDNGRRIDLFALDQCAHFIVIELKRTDVGVFMDLRVIQCATIGASLTFEQATQVFLSSSKQHSS